MKRSFGQSRIFYNHPLCRGLVGAWLFNEGAGSTVYPQLNPNDALTLTVGTTGTGWLSRPGAGMGIGTNNLNTPGSGGGAKLTSPSSALQTTDVVSVFWFGTVLAGGNLGNNPNLVGLGYNAGGSSPFYCWAIARKNSSGADLLIETSYGGSNQSKTIPGVVSTSVAPVSYAASFASGSQLIYKNGIQIGSSSNTGSLSYSGGPFFVSTDYANEDPSLLSSLVLVWHRFLSPQEHLALATNPWRILVPTPRPPRANIAPTPPVAYPNWWIDIQMPQLLPQ